MATDQVTSSHWTVEVFHRNDLGDAVACDPHARAVLTDLHEAGLTHIKSVHASRIFMLSGTLNDGAVTDFADTFFANPVTESFTIHESLNHRTPQKQTIEVHPLPGVMNPEAESALRACRRRLQSPDLEIEMIQTGRRYAIEGAKNDDELDRIARRFLANDCIETWYINGFDCTDTIPATFPEPPRRPFQLRTVEIRSLNDDALSKLSREGHLFLSLDEMRDVQAYYTTLERDPTDLELETVAQTWSEHCVHKTLKSAYAYEGEDFGKPGTIKLTFDNLLAETIAAATNELNKPWCLSVFVDNAGVIAFDDEYGIAFKAETHNHPSAIEPYGGAATGIGGCIRDIMGCGLGAKPIASTDIFCVAPPDFPFEKLPQGVLHPRRILKGIVGGVRDYGNRMGIPTVNGAVVFDERYLANPLVFCGCIGLIPRDKIDKAPQIGDAIIVAGGRTGRDGIHGATFSSAELTDEAADEFSHAVQIGNAIEEKKLLDAQLLARDHADGCLFNAVTDCGAGGLSSAVGEMAEELGADVQLQDVPLKYEGLRYDEIWISEAQERMVFAVPQENVDTMIALFRKEDVEATVIGQFTGNAKLRVFYGETNVGELDMKFLHGGLPKQTLTATWDASAQTPYHPQALEDSSRDLNATMLASIGSLQTASREWIIRQYDHEVQGRSVVKPLTGPNAGPSDAAVIRPRYESPKGIGVSCGICPERGDDDPYLMAILAVDEALRNLICVGADPEQVAILDN
ncbi:MAG: phosphoribosylformylglycinamidine synthase subunit PurS, partial [Phycisphaerae bacterium]